MSPFHQKIHECCVRLCSNLIRTESAIILQLQLVQKFEIHRKLEKKNLYLYAKDVCGLSENQAYTFSSLAKCSLRHSQLDDAIQCGKLSVSKASRLVSTISKDNASDLIDFACRHSKREIEREVRRLNPKASIQATIKPISESLDVLNAAITCEASDNIRKAGDLLAQKHARNVDLGETIALVFEEFVERHDPLKRAARAEKRKNQSGSSLKNIASADETSTAAGQAATFASTAKEQSSTASSASASYPHFSARAEKSVRLSARKTNERNDEPLTASQIHEVDLRDMRKCTHIDCTGHRCSETRWLHYHHIISRADGGSNDPANLTTLCSFHHDLVHQLELPLEDISTALEQLKFHQERDTHLVRERFIQYG